MHWQVQGSCLCILPSLAPRVHHIHRYCAELRGSYGRCSLLMLDAVPTAPLQYCIQIAVRQIATRMFAERTHPARYRSATKLQLNN